jgi:hypothetical protein
MCDSMPRTRSSSSVAVTSKASPESSLLPHRMGRFPGSGVVVQLRFELRTNACQSKEVNTCLPIKVLQPSVGDSLFSESHR